MSKQPVKLNMAGTADRKHESAEVMLDKMKVSQIPRNNGHFPEFDSGILSMLPQDFISGSVVLLNLELL